jgi:hypothetical protein
LGFHCRFGGIPSSPSALFHSQDRLRYNVASVSRILDGERLYGALTGLPLRPVDYPPVSFLIIAGLSASSIPILTASIARLANSRPVAHEDSPAGLKDVPRGLLVQRRYQRRGDLVLSNQVAHEVERFERGGLGEGGLETVAQNSSAISPHEFQGGADQALVLNSLSTKPTSDGLRSAARILRASSRSCG